MVVRFSAIAPTPADGTPLRPRRSTTSGGAVPAAFPTRPAGTPGAPVRVSKTRDGLSALNPCPLGSHPVTSAMMWARPYTKMQAVPLAEIGAITELATVCPLVKLSCETPGRGVEVESQGYADT